MRQGKWGRDFRVFTRHSRGMVLAHRRHMTFVSAALVLAITLVAHPASAQAIVVDEEHALEVELSAALREYAAIDDTGLLVGQTIGGIMVGAGTITVLLAGTWAGSSFFDPEPDYTGRDWAYGTAAVLGAVGLAVLIACVMARHELNLRRHALRTRIRSLRAELGVSGS